MHVSLLTSELNDFIQVLDDRAKSVAQSAKHFIPKSKERKEGSDASTVPPTNAPKWSVDQNWIEGMYGFMYVIELIIINFFC